MSAPSNAESARELLIRDLATDLKPVRGLRSPSMRTLAWLAILAASAAVLAMLADLSVVGRRLTAASRPVACGDRLVANRHPRPLCRVPTQPAGCAPRMGSAAAAGGAVVDRRERFGCLRAWFVPGTHAADLSEARDCLIFIMGMSAPLSALLITMLRRGCPPSGD
jgi:hypothetical protein